MGGWTYGLYLVMCVFQENTGSLTYLHLFVKRPITARVHIWRAAHMELPGAAIGQCSYSPAILLLATSSQTTLPAAQCSKFILPNYYLIITYSIT